MTAEDLRALAADLRLEIDSIDRSLADMAEARAAVGEPASRVALWACGGTLHAFYTGFEKVLEVIATSLNGAPPAGPAWHRRLLEHMSVERPGRRPAVISPETAAELDEYLAFRHRYRNLYLFNLRWEPMQLLLDRAPAVWNRAKRELISFAEHLDRLASASSS